MRTQRIVQSLLLGGVLTAASLAFGQADNSQALISILVKKGILTQEEATQIQKEAAETAAQTPSPSLASAGSGAAPVSGTVAATPGKSPLSFKIGVADFTPFGFMDFTTVVRSTLNGGDIGSSFGSIPYGNTANGQLSETRFSAKNSRIGLRVDSKVGDTTVLGYIESDFLGNAATNINVASNSDVMRMRVYFVDIRKGDLELLAGQDWSLMTPNRKGLSPLPSDIFYTQDVDTNYQVGLVWGRTPQLRATYHATDEWTFGLSLENPDQYVGGAVTLPAGFTATQVDAGAGGTATPNVFPDVVAKMAFDTKLGGMAFHADAAGLVRYFKINTYTASVNSNATETGVGGSFNSSLEILPHFLLIENAFSSNGGGRYVSTGLGPDFIVNPVDSSGTYSLSLVDSYAFMGGFEWDVVPTSKVFGYWGLTEFGQKYDQLANGSYVGYGYPGSSNSNNRSIKEYTLGLAQILWKNASYGDLKVLAQLSYLERTPWYVPAGGPANAHMGMGYLDLRYDLP